MDKKCSYQSQFLNIRIMEFCTNKSMVEIVKGMLNMISINLD